jgi:hypothetical protein
MNTIFRCPHCGSSLDSAGRCACGHGQPETASEQQVTFVPATYIPTGWKCPQCGRIHAPFVSTCPFCAPNWQQPFEITWIGTTPNTWEAGGTSKDPNSWEAGGITVGDPPYDMKTNVFVTPANAEFHTADLQFDSGSISVKGTSMHEVLS